jgi:hypothetical protein
MSVRPHPFSLSVTTEASFRGLKRPGLNGIWKIKTNKGADELIKHRNIINHVKAQRMSWFGHTNRMPETSIVNRNHSQEDQQEGPSLDGKMMSGMI